MQRPGDNGEGKAKSPLGTRRHRSLPGCQQHQPLLSPLRCSSCCGAARRAAGCSCPLGFPWASAQPGVWPASAFICTLGDNSAGVACQGFLQGLHRLPATGKPALSHPLNPLCFSQTCTAPVALSSARAACSGCGFGAPATAEPCCAALRSGDTLSSQACGLPQDRPPPAPTGSQAHLCCAALGSARAKQPHFWLSCSCLPAPAAALCQRILSSLLSLSSFPAHCPQAMATTPWQQ